MDDSAFVTIMEVSDIIGDHIKNNKQLEFEKFSNGEAIYGVDNCGANWNEQAAKKAKSYLDIMSYSRDGLIKQLEFEGITHSQAEYGVSAVGY